MFKVIQTVDYYDWRGAIVRTDKSIVFTSDDVLKTVEWRYARCESGCFVKVDAKQSVTLATSRENNIIDFGEIFRLVEGDAEYLAVLNGQRDAVSEREWFAARSRDRSAA